MSRVIALLALLGALLPGVPPAHAQAPAAQGSVAIATFAGGCFWCMEEAFEAVPGVLSAVSGYIGGKVANPTYEQVSSGGTGHYEAIEVRYDPARVGYAELLEHFWRNVDPTVDDRQFCDIGDMYRAAIFYHDAAQKQLAEQSKRALEQSRKFERVYPGVLPASAFYVAEDYHQDYYRKNPVRYNFYKYSCGRSQRLKKIWGD